MSRENAQAEDVIAQALALSEAASDAPWHPYHIPKHLSDEWIIDSGPTFIASTHLGSERGRTDAEFIAAARTLLPALAKAIGDVLAVCEQAEMSPGSVRAYMADDITATITAALSEVTL